MTTLHFKKSVGRSPLRHGLLFIPLALALALFALSPMARAVNPPPDGGYPNQNTAEGTNALFSNTTGTFNVANGYEALFNNTGGNNNTANGVQALFHNTFGVENAATGSFSLWSNTGGESNTATGFKALFSNTGGDNNTATGSCALMNNTDGGDNTATGYLALEVNTIGGSNTATGRAALFFNENGNFNTATGNGALFGNSTGGNNVANGVSALHSNSNGNNNVANGVNALFHNISGSNNVANGIGAMLGNTTGNGNIAEGRAALGKNTSGSFNVALGFSAGSNLTTGSNNIDIGALGVADESNTMRIGTVKQTKTFITGIRGTATANANAVPVVIDSAGQLGTVGSSRRFKDEIRPMDNSSEAILGLKPVTFHYKTDKQNTPQFGLIAEEVAKVNPDLVVRDDNDEIYTVRYEAVNAMLLNEFLKAHRKLDQQQAMIDRQQKQIEALTATIQKVSDQVALGKPAPQLVANP